MWTGGLPRANASSALKVQRTENSSSLVVFQQLSCAGRTHAAGALRLELERRATPVAEQSRQQSYLEACVRYVHGMEASRKLLLYGHSMGSLLIAAALPQGG